MRTVWSSILAFEASKNLNPTPNPWNGLIDSPPKKEKNHINEGKKPYAKAHHKMGGGEGKNGQINRVLLMFVLVLCKELPEQQSFTSMDTA